MNLPDSLYREARVRAAQEGRTVTSVLEEALRTFLERGRPETQAYVVRPLTTLRPGEIPFDVADNAATRDYLDAFDADADS